MWKKESTNERERTRGRGKDNHLLFQFKRISWWEQGPESACGDSHGAKAFIRASLTEAIRRDYGRFTVFSEGPAGAPWKLLNWEMSESGRRIEQCFVSEGEVSLAHQEWSHKVWSQRDRNTNLHAQWHAYSQWARSHKPYKGRSKFVCRVPISISGFKFTMGNLSWGGLLWSSPGCEKRNSNPFTLCDGNMCHFHTGD